MGFGDYPSKNTQPSGQVNFRYPSDSIYNFKKLLEINIVIYKGYPFLSITSIPVIVGVMSTVLTAQLNFLGGVNFEE